VHGPEPEARSLEPEAGSRKPFAPTTLALVAIGLLVLLFGTGPSWAQQQSSYVIGPQDVLAISVWEQPDLTGKFTVETDGSFTYPFVGRLKAAGMTLRDLEAELTKRLSDGYLKKPQVSVAVDEYRSQRIFVVGEVRQAGAYPLTGDMTLIEALAKAGSTTSDGSGEAIIVHAPTGKVPDGPVLPGQLQGADVVRVDLKRLQEGDASQNVPLRGGDTVFVPRAETIYVFGQVRSPGAYALQTKDTTVLQALSLAGGVTDRGASNRIRIVRIINGEKKEFRVKLTDPVLPGDTIVVPERFF
jgi:polysaccharide biosynthesis/export protein